MYTTMDEKKLMDLCRNYNLIQREGNHNAIINGQQQCHYDLKAIVKLLEKRIKHTKKFKLQKGDVVKIKGTGETAIIFQLLFNQDGEKVHNELLLTFQNGTIKHVDVEKVRKVKLK